MSLEELGIDETHKWTVYLTGVDKGKRSSIKAEGRPVMVIGPIPPSTQREDMGALVHRAIEEVYAERYTKEGLRATAYMKGKVLVCRRNEDPADMRTQFKVPVQFYY